MRKISWMFLLSSAQFWGCGNLYPVASIDVSNMKEAWDANNDPKRLKDHYEVSFAKLPLSAELKRKPWTDSYWPSNHGGLASRWNDPESPNAFSYPLLTREQLAAMPRTVLQQLSPAEKYDILQGRLDYPLVKAERTRTNPEHPSWYGLCHGWAPAAINFDEPHPITLHSVLGVEVPFGSSDIKALLSLAQQSGRGMRSLGERCDHDLDADPSHAQDPECRDTNAGSFHIIVTNQIGLIKEGIVADISRGAQVWNQPIFGFESEIAAEPAQVYPTAAPGTVQIVTVTTTLKYISELDANWDPRPFEKFPSQQGEKLLKYNLEIDQAGQIIGGEWLTEERPDFLWTQKRPIFSGYLRRIEALYEASVRR